MESVANSVVENRKEMTDIGSSNSVGVEQDTEAIADTIAVESSHSESSPITKSNLEGAVTSDVHPVSETLSNEEEEEVLEKMEDVESHGMELEEQTEPLNLSDSIETIQDNVTTSSDIGDKSNLQNFEGVELSETISDVDSKSEMKVATTSSLETKMFVAVSNVASPASPPDSSIDDSAISPLVSTDSNMAASKATQEEAEVPPTSSAPKKGFRFRSNKSRVHAETPTTIPVCNQQKRILRSKKSERQRSSSLVLSSLPIDSLHSIASFLRPIEWKNFGQCNKATNKICREIFRRVRMHGFRCATEVVTAWKFGQHADAKELCALYVSSGVPVYPHSLGHSYHTLVWRLRIEAKHLQEKVREQENTKNEPSPSNNVDRYPHDPLSVNVFHVDQFYNEREDFRRDDLVDDLGESDLTYLEEKSLYNLNMNRSNAGMISRSTHRRRTSEAHRIARDPLAAGFPPPQGAAHAPQIPPPFPFEAQGTPRARSSWVSNAGAGHGAISRRGVATRSRSFSGSRHRTPKVSLKIHRHLLDQHLLGRSAVNDFEGSMTPPTVSLSADFFHPFFSFRNQRSGSQNSGLATTTTGNLLAAMQQIDNDQEGIEEQRVPSRFGSNVVNDSDSDGEADAVFPVDPTYLMDVNERMAVGPTVARQVTSISARSSNQVPFATEVHAFPHQVTAQNTILSNTDLTVYSASSKSQKSENIDIMERKLNNYLNARFTVYHCCLERHLMNNDCEKFDETIMDFWDEFFPQTEDIQYYDCYTAVPRTSRLEKFLTKPCPKQIGVVQCEIERVKLNSKKKGVNMKGRFFPTYEYRLFIRHRPPGTSPSYDFVDLDNNNDTRRDTVLMTAKNRGRKHSDNTVQASKKGSNNYYLSLPQQDDLDLHYMTANGLDDTVENSPNGVGTKDSSSEFSGLLGRLQSNFVGTEFQIFTPRPENKEKKSQFFSKSSISSPCSVASGANSDDETLYDSVRQREDRPRGRFRRLSLKGRNSYNGDMSTEFSEPYQVRSSPFTLRRSRSGDVTPAGRSRKVSAAESFFESQHFKAEPQRTFYEEEDGAITYTANLLGSRPRIMDVCIPKVNSNGTGAEWRRYLENCKEEDFVSSADRLLNHLKLLQQNGQPEENGRSINPANNGDEGDPGDDEQAYTPPSDYGLLALQNRPPWWNVELGSFVLNFGGRVSVASVKNFQLCDRNEQDHIMLQFGRIEGRHSFTMDFQYPLTAVQAFAIAISSLQSKISFG